MTSSKLKAFSLLELLVVITVIAILAGLLLSAGSWVVESGRRTKCLSNLRQIAVAVQLYAVDNNGRFPVFSNFDVPLQPYTQNKELFYCPDNRDPKGKRPDGGRNDYFLSLLMNDFIFEPNGHVHAVGKLLSNLPDPALTVMCGDATGTLKTVMTTPQGKVEGMVRHFSGANYVFMDGHAMWLTPEDALNY